MAEHEDRATTDYTVLPAPIPREAMRTTQDVRPMADPKSEWDRETEFLLRTAGIPF